MQMMINKMGQKLTTIFTYREGICVGNAQWPTLTLIWLEPLNKQEQLMKVFRQEDFHLKVEEYLESFLETVRRQ